MTRKIIFRLTTSTLILWTISTSVFAQMTLGEISGAAQRSADKSRQALVAIFGNVVNDPLSAAGGTDTPLAGIFMVTNSTLLVVGGIIACYHFLRKISQTAHDGTAFDQQKHILWGPIRILWGVASVVPTPNGWSVAQLLMLWGASIMGVGTANLAVDQAVSAFNDGSSMVMQPVLPSTVDVSRAVFEASLCMHGINLGLTEATNNGALIPFNEYVQRQPTANGFVLKNHSFVCGGSDLPNSFDSTPATNSWFSSNIPVEQLRQAHLTALKEMQGVLDAGAKGFVTAVLQRQIDGTTNIPSAETIIHDAAQKYETTVNMTAATFQGNIKALAASLSSSLSESGWWTLGAWYQTFAQANTKLSSAVASKASTYGMGPVGDPATLHLYAAAMLAYKAQQGISTYTPPLGTNSTGDYTKTVSATEASKVIGGIFSAPGQRLADALVNVNFDGAGLGQVNPLIKMKNIGDYILGTAQTAVAVWGAIKGIAYLKEKNILAGIFAKIANFVVKSDDGSLGMLDALSPIIIMIIVALFLLGGALSVYLPFVPFIVWFGAAINWLIVVGEAVIAAPLWAITHVNGNGGDGLGEKSTYGWIFLLNVMLRPLLMVCGFFLAGACLIAGGTLLNQLFGVGIANVQFDSITGLATILFMLAIYASMATNLVHSCFNLVFIVPDQVINWIGGHASSALGRDDNDKVRHTVAMFSGRLDEALNRYANRPREGDNRRRPQRGDGFKS